ncbi:MAG: DUF72 domain-containing protein [Candidatus Thermoplasmatota archaeon]|nr:DUF72 domain-containing protein [Candidatus Thermoplasmatota archaeon]MDI6887973.1 DUF72 domain-containing protein [Candidatus Thermoplasmatota archaeon]
MKIGCCGFPKGMKEYFKNFDVVEVQRTFYEPPSIEILKKWRAQAPREFEFTVKAWQVITHPATSPTYRKSKYKPKECGFFKPCKEIFEAWEKMTEVCSALNVNIVVFQCPASFKPAQKNIKNIYEFFNSIKSKSLTFIWEPRGEEWRGNVIKKICTELNLIHCVDPFKSSQQSGKFSYFRLHGIGGYRYRYSKEELEKLLSFCTPSSYVMFNNTYMFENAIEFKELVRHGRKRQ